MTKTAKRTIAASMIGAGVLGASGLAQATDFTWALASSGNLEVGSNWTGGDGTNYPSTNADSINISLAGADCKPTAALEIGELIVTRGIFNPVALPITTPTDTAARTIRISSAGGRSGDLTAVYTSSSNYGVINAGPGSGSNANAYFDVDGNVSLPNSLNIGGNSQYRNHLTMRGVSKTINMATPWSTVTIASGASVSGTADSMGGKAGTFTVDGTITGGTWTVGAGGVKGMASSGGKFTGGTLKHALVNQTTLYTVNLAGGDYWSIDLGQTGLGSSGSQYHAKFVAGGDMNIGGAFTPASFTNTQDRVWEQIFDTSNGTTSANLTVGGAFTMGGSTTTTFVQLKDWSFVANASIIDITGAAKYDRYARVTGGTSTWKFGSDVTFTSVFNAANSDFTGTSFVFDKTTSLQTLTTAGVKLGDVSVNKASGTLKLADSLTLAGDLQLLSGTLDPNGNIITFAGTEEALAISDGSLVLPGIGLQASTIVNLGTDVSATTATMAAGSVINTLGHTLTIGSTTYLPNTGSHAFDGGMIVTSVPEPTSLGLLGLGAVAGLRRRRRA